MLSRVLVSGALLVAVGCSSAQFLKKGEQHSAQDAEKATDLEVQAGMEGPEAALALSANLTILNFKIDVDSCSSGKTASLTLADSSASLYANDNHCVGKLIQFTVDADDDGDGSKDTYVLSGSFSSYNAGGTATFVSGPLSLEVKVVKQLPDKLAPSILVEEHENCFQIKYAAYGIDKGNRRDITPDPIGAKGSVVGTSGAFFHLKQALMLDIDGTDGAGIFKFKLKCVSDLTSPQCADAISKVHYQLVDDNSADHSLTLFAAQTLFASNPGSIPASASDSSFYTINLKGPAKVDLNRDMLLVLQIGDAYQYFPIHINDLVEINCDDRPGCGN